MKVFIGSTKEQNDNGVLRTVALLVENSGGIPICWNEPGLFIAGTNTLNNLIEIAKSKVDAAILLYSPDDKVWYRNSVLDHPRDNIIFEHGLFLGVLGDTNAIAIKSGNPKFSSDLAGITHIEYSIVETEKFKKEIRVWIDSIRNNHTENLRQREMLVRRKELISNELIIQSGLKNFFPSRDFYPLHRNNSPSISSYIKSTRNKLMMISVNLITAIEYDDICNIIIDKIKNQNVEIKISLLDFDQHHLIKTISETINIEPKKLKDQIKKAINILHELKESLPETVRSKFEIKVHKAIPFGSAILIDYDQTDGKIQIETKPHNAPLINSFAFEIIPPQVDGYSFFKTLATSYLSLYNEGREISKKV